MNPSPIQKRARKYVWLYLALILFLFSFGLGFFVGGGWYVKKEISNENGEVSLEKVLKINRNLSYNDKVDFEQFWEVWDRVKEKYAKQPVSDLDMFYGAIQGLVYSLQDPYSLYFTPKQANEFAESLTGEFEGIGAEIGVKLGQLTVVSPLPDSPAQKAGLRPGDKIIKIDDQDTYDMGVSEAVSIIRGEAGTEVVLTVLRDELEEAKEISIVRGRINVPSILYEMKEEDVAYLRVMQFNEKTPRDLDNKISKLLKVGAKKVILDLRSNPGGYLDSAIDMSSEWVKKGDIIVSEKSSEGVVSDDRSVGPSRLNGLPTVVLVNGGSASASEIVAGALKDNGLATIVGEKTFGKGSVQDFEVFGDGSALKLTIAEWLTPNGVNINEQGIEPDVVIEEDWANEGVGEDAMLDKALEILNN